MASSQVGIASSTSPFARRNAWRDHHLNTSNVSVSSGSATPNQNAKKSISNANNKNLGSLSFSGRLHNIFKENDDSSLSALVSPKIIDRWAAKQAQEALTVTRTTTTVEFGNHHHEVEVFDDFPPRREASASPPRSDGSSRGKISSLGASSLVQIWEERFNKSKPCTPAASPGRTSLDNAGLCNASCCVEEQCRVSEEGESSDEAQGNEESSPNWESARTSQSDQSCSLKVQSSDATESGRVANLIKRLAVTNQKKNPMSLISDDNDNSDPCIASMPKLKQPEHRVFAQVISSPRIRGRQAFNDLMMQFENERHGELNNLAERGAVSKFAQRGRVQSVLRLRLLQRGVTALEKSPQKSAASEVNRQQQGSVIMQLRERFNTEDEHRTSSLAEVSDSRSPARETVSNTTQLDNFPITNQLSEDSSCKSVYSPGIHCKESAHNSISQTRADNKEKAHPSSDVTVQRTLFEAQNDEAKETTEASLSIADSNANEAVDKVEANYQQHATAEPSYDEILEEEDASDQNYDEACYDWISQISRPRSYWEELRNQWYKEMLDFGSQNDDIRKLLERKTVSTVLSCNDFRKRMDRMMKSHKGTQTDLVNSQYDMEDQEGSIEQLMEFFHDRLRSRGSPQDDGRDGGEEEEARRNNEEEEEDEEEEEKSTVCSGSDHELGDYFNQTPLSMNTPSSSTWSYRDNDAGDDSDRVASVSSPPPSQQYTSSVNHHSTEMEYIYDMRGQMVQLFNEMSELRKSIKSCMDMQMQLQQSKYQKVHPVKEEEEEQEQEQEQEEEEETKESINRTPKKGICSICYENKVNSVLYRCGHMCACFKCANELQWNSGKCPICQAEIIDVLRVCTEY